MNSKCNMLRVAALALALSLNPQLGQAAIPIEFVQREFQARFNLDTYGNYVLWPPGKCGSPAPLYPPDGFYGNLDHDPAFAAYLVSDLCAQFYGGYWPLFHTGQQPFDSNWDDPLYYPFWIRTSPNLEGQSNVPSWYDDSDFPVTGAGFSLANVTTANYLACFATIKSYIERLESIGDIGGLGPVDQVNGLDLGGGGYSSTNSCSEAKAEAAASWTYYENPWLNGSPMPFDKTFSTYLVVTNEQEEVLESWYAGKSAIRARVYCSPTSVPGLLRFYLAATVGPDCIDVGPTGPPVSTDGKFHLFLAKQLDGANTWYDNEPGRQVGLDNPPVGDNCPETNSFSLGWVLTQGYGIFTPQFRITPDDVPPCGGSAGGGVGGGAGGCNDCPDCNAPGTVTAKGDALDVRISLGADSFGHSAGSLYLRADTPSDILYRPEGLDYTLSSSSWAYPSLGPEQIMTPNVTASFQLSSSGYIISFTNHNEIPPAFLSSVTVSSNSVATNQVLITQVTGAAGSPRVFQYIYTNTAPGINTWGLVQGSGLRSESRSTAWPTPSNRVDTIVLSDSDGAVAQQITEYHFLFPWGLTLTNRTFGTGASAKATTWVYYQASDGSNNIGQLKQVIESSGRWERYQYDYGGRLTNKVAQFCDNSISTPDSSNRVTQISFDDATAIITTIEKLLSIEIARAYQIQFAADASGIQQSQAIRCTSAGAAITATGNLTNAIWVSTNNWETIKTLSSDGTMTFYSYSTNTQTVQKTTVVTAGAPNVNRDAITDGTRTTTVVGAWGEVLSSTLEDIASNLIIDQQSYLYTDALKRSYIVTHLNGRTETMNYSCCGLDTEIDRDGVTTQYIYDAAKRQVATTRLGITTTNVLDAAGRVLKSIRIGTDDSQTVLNFAAYATDGSVMAQTNALNGVTVYSEGTNALGQTVVTNIYPDGGTRISSYYQDGSLLSITGTGVHPLRYVYGVDADGPFTFEIKVAEDGGTNEWVKTSTDPAGRAWKTLYPDGANSRSFFDTEGQLWKEVDPDGVTSLFQYSVKGEQLYTALDTNRNDLIDFAGADRITFTTNDVVTSHGTTVRRSRTYVWSTINSAVSNLVSMSESSVDGLESWHTVYRDAATPVVSHSQTVYGANGNRWLTNTAPDNSYTVSAYFNGRLASVTRRDSLNNQLSALNYSFDSHDRQRAVTDARNGTTVLTLNAADQVESITTPHPGTLGGSPQTTFTFHDKSLRATNVVHPDGASVTTEFYLTGAVKRKYGSRTYPVGYSYDHAGRMKTMTNWSDLVSGAGARVTTWNYDAYRGWLTNKTYDSGAPGPIYTYTGAGRPLTRRWARDITTSYHYESLGVLRATTYSDGTTPNVTNAYDRLGRAATVTCNGMTSTFTYNTAEQLLSETWSGGVLDGMAVTNAYDSFLRRTTLGLNTQPSTLTEFGYDNASRLAAVTNGTSRVAYAYVANSPLVSQITFTNNGVERMTTIKQYDFLNRLSTISTINSQPSTINSFSYSYNNANQRTRRIDADGSYWWYEYDPLGQVTSGKKYWSDGTPVAGQQFEYAFDDIGNRVATKAGGDQNGANLRGANYGANSLNQYTNRDVPGYVQITGVAFATNAVTVNNQATYRKGEYFWKELGVDNGSTPQWHSVSVGAAGETTIIGNIFLPKTQEVFAYDLDGNLTSDGRFIYTWDAENRLTQVESLISGPAASKRKVGWVFDSRGRRIQQTTYDGSSGTYVVLEDLKFLSDGWQHIAELNATNNNLVRSYVWGLDISGTTDGTGGIGGLLMLNSVANGTHFYCFDGNGNSAALLSASEGSASAEYAFDPFGGTIRATGPLAVENPFRFSAKRTDETSELILYEVRAYCPSLGRFASLDPVGDFGGHNLYRFVRNDGINNSDLLGMVIICCDPEEYFSNLGLIKGQHYEEPTKDYYVARRGATFDAGNSTEKLIVWRMLLARHAFKAKDKKVSQLKVNIGARKKIVDRAPRANFPNIGTDRLSEEDWRTFRANWDGFFDTINGTQREFGCQVVAMIIYQSANHGHLPDENRAYDGVWIPGDWGFIRNLTWERNREAYPPNTRSLYKGENVFHIGTGSLISGKTEDTFWGAYSAGVHDAECESCWFDNIRRWSPAGDPKWSHTIQAPGIGLDPNSERIPRDE